MTGGARGLGRDVALGLADAGAAVGVVDGAATASVARSIVEAGRRAVAVDAAIETFEEASNAFWR